VKSSQLGGVIALKIKTSTFLHSIDSYRRIEANAIFMADKSARREARPKTGWLKICIQIRELVSKLKMAP
jgi:hypothetical protein